MTKFFSQIASPTGLLWIFLVTTQIVSGIYLSRGIEPPASHHWVSLDNWLVVAKG
jgi:hypothetical protein